VSRLEDLVGLIASELADYPDLVDVTEVEHPDKTVVEVFVSPGDLGRIIGRQGRTASALRVLLAAAEPEDRETLLEFREIQDSQS
jgi:predicted RNA-binding protein YlqC (UPF0109 family)